MTTPEPPDRDSTGPRSEEDDPTGVRALLAGLADPGPMPEDLVRRIGDRLEVERAYLAAGRPDTLLDQHGDRVIDLADQRSRRRPGRTLALLGAAAAGLAVTTVALTQVLGGTDDVGIGTAAQYPSRDASGSDSAGSDDSAGGAGPESMAGADDLPDQGDTGEDGSSATQDGMAGFDGESGAELLAPSVEVTVLPALGRVQEADYGDLILRESREGARRTDSGALLTPTQARTCWAGVDHSGWTDHYAAPATYVPETSGTEDVVVLLGLDETGAGQAWVLPEGCVTSPGIAPLDPAGTALPAP